MSVYLTGFLSEQSAINRSEEIANFQGCTRDVTRYWFRWFKHSSSDEWSLDIIDGHESLLTQDEQNACKTYIELDSNGWFTI